MALGVCRLVRFVQSLVDKIAHKGMVSMHIAAYLLIIVANVVQTFYVYPAGSQDLRGYEITTICSLVVYSVSDLIFGLLVNAIVAKIVGAANSSDLKFRAVSLMTGSFEGDEEEQSQPASTKCTSQC
jgi:hypothetical protein